MTLRPLTNAAWGFDSNCFVCEPKNTHGIRLPFSHDDEAGLVTAEFSLGDTFSGAPSYVHGGVLLAILDEAMAWATIAVGGVFALTQRTETIFHRPVRIGSHYRVEARVGDTDGEKIEASGVIINAGGNPCAEASSTFVVMSPAQATDALGAEVSADEAGFLRG